MNSLFDAEARAAIVVRLERLTPENRRRWGRMSAAQMLAHLADHLRLALGDAAAKPMWVPLRLPVVKQFVVYWMPWPRGAPTAPELLRSKPTSWDADHAELLRLVERFCALEGRREWPAHPAFGRLSPRAWGVLAYRHLDHHLRQFSG